MIDRRTALAGVIALFGTAVFAPIARAAQDGSALVIDTGAPSSPLFTAEQRALVTALSERVIPATDTPGAIAAEVPQFIEKLLQDWALPEERIPVLAGLDVLEERARKDFAITGAQASEAQQDILLTLAMKDEIPGGKLFFTAFRQLVISGYYTSDIGITQEREYLPVPGTYDGQFLYSNVNKVYSS